MRRQSDKRYVGLANSVKQLMCPLSSLMRRILPPRQHRRNFFITTILAFTPDTAEICLLPWPPNPPLPPISQDLILQPIWPLPPTPKDFILPPLQSNPPLPPKLNILPPLPPNPPLPPKPRGFILPPSSPLPPRFRFSLLTATLTHRLIFTDICFFALVYFFENIIFIPANVKYSCQNIGIIKKKHRSLLTSLR